MACWRRDFDSWAIVDTRCFHLFDRTPHAFRKVDAWARLQPEFERRAAFARLASVALHDQEAGDEQVLQCSLPTEQAALDNRNFVKKGGS
jgi:3-methyladenine DNA glycosylase AlkD